VSQAIQGHSRAAPRAPASSPAGEAMSARICCRCCYTGSAGTCARYWMSTALQVPQQDPVL